MQAFLHYVRSFQKYGAQTGICSENFTFTELEETHCKTRGSYLNFGYLPESRSGREFGLQEV